jgi:CheY-like chemotaxis protein
MDVLQDLTSSPAEQPGTILVVEDDATIQCALADVLDSLGYRVLMASHGHEALMLFDQAEEPIDLVFSDVVMPRMGGLELAKTLHAQRPTLPVILTSGYLMDAAEFEQDNLTWLAKPFPVDTLDHTLRTLLAQPDAQAMTPACAL